MSSAAKVKANRANARASTGPKTARGKARSARNGHRHGLSIPVVADHAWSEEVKALADEIAGADTDPELYKLACRIAEAHVDLRRIRCVRHALLSTALDDPAYLSKQAKRNMLKAMAGIENRKVPPDHAADLFVTRAARMNRDLLQQKGPQKFATILSDMANQLAAIVRYERRALSRRKFAIRAFDAARQQTV
jgi:hypothetical protein